MSLIKCPECGKEISDKAVSCPSCGSPIKQTSKKSIKGKVLLSVFFIFTCAIVLLSVFDKKDTYDEHSDNIEIDKVADDNIEDLTKSKSDENELKLPDDLTDEETELITALQGIWYDPTYEYDKFIFTDMVVKIYYPYEGSIHTYENDLYFLHKDDK
jgi:DNA-directed RNA polymerase subunit RPC12/RpoP